MAFYYVDSRNITEKDPAAFCLSICKKKREREMCYFSVIWENGVFGTTIDQSMSGWREEGKQEEEEERQRERERGVLRPLWSGCKKRRPTFFPLSRSVFM